MRFSMNDFSEVIFWSLKLESWRRAVSSRADWSEADFSANREVRDCSCVLICFCNCSIEADFSAVRELRDCCCVSICF